MRQSSKTKKNQKRTALLAVPIIVISLIIIAQLGLSQTKVISYTSTPIDSAYLEKAKIGLNLECLQDSQCSEDYECIKTACVPKESIDICKDIALAPMSRPLFIGNSINMQREVFTETLLPHLLADGSLIELINDEPFEYKYAQMLYIGNRKLVNEDGKTLIKTQNSDDFLYKYVIYFSQDMDFSNKNLQGQVLKLLGKEYIIGSESTDSDLYLISNDRRISLQDGKEAIVGNELVSGTKVNMIKGESGGIVSIEILFDEGNDKISLAVGESYSDPLFNSIELNFNSYFDKAGLMIGGKC